MISWWAMYTEISWYVKCSSLWFYMNNYILPCDVTSSCGTIQPGLICITHIHFSHQFCEYILKHNFYKFVLLVKVTQDRNEFWCDLSCDFSYSFCRSEIVHDNHQCCHWGNLMHIDMIFQYCIILEIIICRSLETLFVSWFHNSFFYQFPWL